MGTQPPFPQRGWSRQFSAHVYCGQMAAWIKVPLGTEVGLGPDDIELEGSQRGASSPLPKKGTEPPPQFTAYVYCGQTAGWIKVALGVEVGLDPGHIVQDGNPAPLPKKGAEPPIFGPFLLWPNGWMHQDATWYGGRPQPRQLLCSMGTQLPQKKGHIHPTQFLVHICCGQTSRQRYCTASSSGRQPNFVALNRGRHLCSAGRPSRWALAHILVRYIFDCMLNAMSLGCSSALIASLFIDAIYVCLVHFSLIIIRSCFLSRSSQSNSIYQGLPHRLFPSILPLITCFWNELCSKTCQTFHLVLL